MTAPRKTSRKAFQEFEGARWNAMIDLLALSELEDLTPIQRRAHLAFWYASEVDNGGHWQYFCNRSEYDHNEVIEALCQVGATDHAEILRQALARLPENTRRPETVQQFIDGYDQVNMYDLDVDLGNCNKEICDYLGEYLDQYENEFIEWTP